MKPRPLSRESSPLWPDEIQEGTGWDQGLSPESSQDQPTSEEWQYQTRQAGQNTAKAVKSQELGLYQYVYKAELEFSVTGFVTLKGEKVRVKGSMWICLTYTHSILCCVLIGCPWLTSTLIFLFKNTQWLQKERKKYNHGKNHHKGSPPSLNASVFGRWEVNIMTRSGCLKRKKGKSTTKAKIFQEHNWAAQYYSHKDIVLWVLKFKVKIKL